MAVGGGRWDGAPWRFFLIMSIIIIMNIIIIVNIIIVIDIVFLFFYFIFIFIVVVVSVVGLEVAVMMIIGGSDDEC